MLKIEKYIAGTILLVLIVGHVAARFAPEFFHQSFIIEDGFTEWLAVVGLVCSIILSFKLAMSQKELLPRLTFIGFMFLFIFAAGEEISWGQRIFNIEASEFFKANNAQAETNLHNLTINGVKINKLVFGKILSLFMIIYFLFLPIVYKKVQKVRDLVDKFCFPIPTRHHVGLLFICFIISELTPSHRKGELIELAGVWIFFLIMLNPYNKSVRSS